MCMFDTDGNCVGLFVLGHDGLPFVAARSVREVRENTKSVSPDDITFGL